MRIQVAQTDGELPVITDLGGFGIGQLEGFNGVGKTLTVSVVELCSGRRPPLNAAAWKGLCDGIGRLEITATELNGADEMRWVLDGAHLWSQTSTLDSLAPPELTWFDAVTVDGRATSSFDQVRALFGVERINGDVGLVEQLAGIADSAVRELESYRDGLYGSAKLGEVETDIVALRDMVSELVVERVAGRAEALSRLTEERKRAERVAGEAAERRDRLHEAVKSRARIEEIAISGAELDAQIADLDQRIGGLRRQRDVVLAELEAAEAAAGQSTELQRELAKATRGYKSANTRVGNLTRDLAADSLIAGVGDDDDVETRHGELEQDLEHAHRARVEVDAGPQVVRLIDRVRPALVDAESAGLSEEPLLSAPARAHDRWTVHDVAAALRQRRDELADRPRPNEAAELDRQIAAIAHQLDALRRFQRNREELVRATERRTKAAKRSEQLAKELDQPTADRLDDLRRRRGTLDDDLLSLGGQRAFSVARRDSLGAPEQRDALAARLQERLGELGLNQEHLPDAYAAALQAAEHERDALADVRDRERVAEGDHERDVADVSRLINELRVSGSVAWMAGGTVGLPVIDQSLNEQLDGIRRLQQAVRGADERLTGIRALLLGVIASAEAVADELRNRPVRAAVRVDEVRGWLERYSAGWFADDDFRDALLGGGAHDVVIDLHSRLVKWQDAEAQHRTKPIEALSSGERAFAFTQARLALLQRSVGSTANRLIALDEFGAFVARNRVRQLADYLDGWRSTHASDQFLLILPATQDYTALARASDGADADRYARMAQELTQKQWFVEEFQAP